jgi:hypothetical protein
MARQQQDRARDVATMLTMLSAVVSGWWSWKMTSASKDVGKIWLRGQGPTCRRAHGLTALTLGCYISHCSAPPAASLERLDSKPQLPSHPALRIDAGFVLAR